MASRGRKSPQGIVNSDSLAYSGTTAQAVHKMDDEEFLAVVRRQIEDAEQFIEEDVSPEREKSWRYYDGKTELGSQEGRSSFVMSEVRDTVDAIMPILLEIFATGKRIGEFVPEEAEHATKAEEATDAVNWVFLKKNRGWRHLYDAFHDGLVAKTAIMKAYVEEDTQIDERRGPLSEQDAIAVAGQDGFEVKEYDPETQDTLVQHSITSRNIRVETVPPEEFVIDRRAQDPGEATVLGQRTVMRAGQVVAMGFDSDTIYAVAGGSHDDTEVENERQARQGYSDTNRDDASHWALAEVQFYELYCRIDRDGTGVPQLWQIFAVGEPQTILTAKKVGTDPYVIGSPLPKPHTVIGNSVADRLRDIQDLSTVFARGLIDNLNLVNNPRHGLVEGQVNIEDYRDNRYGGGVRMRSPNAIVPLTVPFIGDKVNLAQEWLEGRKELRTGVSRASQGLDADALQSSTEIGVREVVSAAQKKIALYARCYAETLVGPLYMKILRLMTEYMDEVSFQDRNSDYQTRKTDDFDIAMLVDVKVGLGNGDKAEKIGALREIKMTQEQILQTLGPQNPITSFENYTNTLHELVELTPLYDGAKYFTGKKELPQKLQQWQAQQQQSAQQGDPEAQAKAQAIQQKAQLELQKAQQEAQIDTQKLQFEQQIEQQKAEQEAALKQRAMEGDLAIKKWKAEQEIELRRAELAMEARLEEMKVRMNPGGPGVGNIPRDN